jgi:hypothetical protein
MKLHLGLRALTVFVFSFSWALLLVSAQPSRSLQQDREGIEALHRLDLEMTLSGKADNLRKLWDKDACAATAWLPGGSWPGCDLCS